MVDLSLVKPEHLWYVVGLIATDGNLSKDGRHINLTSKDRGLLLAVRRALLVKNKIGRKARGGESVKKYSVLQIGDRKFYDYLLGIGLTKRKSLTLGELVVPRNYFHDFFRGVIDGDGSIARWVHATNGNVQWSLRVVSGSRNFLAWLKDCAEKEFKVAGKLYGQQSGGRKNPLYVLKFGKFAAKAILPMCYYKGCLALNRKLKSSIKCLQSEDGLRKYGKFVSTNYI